MAVVKLDGLTKVYDRSQAPAAEDVTLEIGHGEFMVLLGPSGCGKTTTLRMIAGLESITSGTLSIDGKVVNKTPAKDRDIAMVFQSYALYPHMSVRDNLAFGLKRRHMSRDAIARRVREVAATLGLETMLERKPHALSGGQRQRVALGRAIIRDPKVFLFDEPLSNLDARLRVSTRSEIASLHRRLGATMIYVTHDQVEAMTLGTRICIMSGGRIVQVGKPLEVYHRPADVFVASFLGNPPMNLLPAATVEGGRGRALRIGEATIEMPADRVRPLVGGARLSFGIRPEDVAITPGGAGESTKLTGEVSQIELLGAETLVAAAVAGAGALTARVAGTPPVSVGDRLDFFTDPRTAHVFDGDGRSLLRPDDMERK